MVQFDSIRDTDLDLVDVNLAVLFLQFRVGYLHGIYRSHRITKVLGRNGGGLHIERLLDQLRKLGLVHAFLLQRPQCALLYGILDHPASEPNGGVAKIKPKLTFPGPLRSLANCSL